MSKSKFLCNLPWDHLSVHPHGLSSVCCEANFDSPQSTASTNTNPIRIKDGIEATINSDTYKSIRKEMVEGKVPEACLSCWKVEQAGGKSKRQHVTNKDIDYSIEEDGGIKVDLKNVELRLGNFCNLKCRGCNAESSTSWISDYYKLKDEVRLPSSYDKLKKAEYTDYTWTDSNEFYDDLINNARNMELLQISGGEPFLVDKHAYLVDRLVNEGIAKNLTVAYVTNANYSFDKIKPVLDRLKEFKKVVLSVSIDDVAERNTYMRSLSNWNLTIKNLKRYVNEYPSFDITVTQTFNILNFMYAEELYLYLRNEGLDLHIVNNHILNPDYMNANILQKEVRQEKLDSIKGIVPDYMYDSLHGFYYNSEQVVGLADEFLKVTEAIDKVRRESFKDTYPKLYNTITSVI